MNAKNYIQGFTLIQVGIILTVASLVMVATLPSAQTSLNANKITVNKMNSVLNALRQYQMVNATLPCPADPAQDTGSTSYGVASANSGTTNKCTTGTAPNAAYAMTTTASPANPVAIGMVPVKTLGLSSDYALDGYGRDITYTVDTGATACWSQKSLPGAITVNDSGITQNTILTLVSHGADGFGAWLPYQGTGAHAQRLNNGVADTSQAANAQVVYASLPGSLTPNTAFAPFQKISTIDDLLVYKSTQWNINTLPTVNGMPAMIPQANGTYYSGNTLTFTLQYPSVVTVTGTPRLILSALGSGSIGTFSSSYKGYATYQPTLSTPSTLKFTYTVQSGDSAPTSGLAMTAPIDLNGGTITGSSCFIPPDLSKVLITGGFVWIADMGHHKVIQYSLTGTPGITIGTGTSGKTDYLLKKPGSVVLDNAGDIWIIDSGNSRVMEFDPTGTVWMKTIGGKTTSDVCAGVSSSPTTCSKISGFANCCPPDGTSCTCTAGNGNGQFNFGGASPLPSQLAFDNSGYLWVVDRGSTPRIQKFDPATGAYLTQVNLPVGGIPMNLAIDNGNNFWLLLQGTGFCKLYMCTAAGSCNPTSTGGCGNGGGDQFNTNSADSDYINFDASGNIYVVDEGNSAVHKFSPAGAYMSDLLVNQASTGYNFTGIYFDPTGAPWLSTEDNNALYKLDPATGIPAVTIPGFSGPQLSYHPAR